MHVADGVTGSLTPRPESGRRSNPFAIYTLVRLLVLRHDPSSPTVVILEGSDGEAWKEDLIFQMHVLDEIIGKLLYAGVKRAP